MQPNEVLELSQQLQRRQPPSRLTVTLLALILVVLVVGLAVTIGLLLDIRSQVHQWGDLLDGLFGYTRHGA